jgi:hypothetical protein
LGPLGRRPEDDLQRVDELLLPSGGGWDEQKLHQDLSLLDVSNSLQIHHGKPGPADYPGWDFTKNVKFSVNRHHHGIKQKQVQSTILVPSKRALEIGQDT